MSEAERNSPPATNEDALAQLNEGRKRDAEVTFSDGRRAIISGTEDEINAAVGEVEAQITAAKEQAAARGDQQAGQEVSFNEGAAQKENQESFLEAVAKQGVANAELGLTMLSGAIAEPVSGLAGLLALAGTGGNADLAAEWVKEVGETLTFTPKTERGKATGAAIAAPLMKLEEKIDDISVKGGRGNPFAAAMIKTVLLGAPELVSGAVGGVRRVKVLKKLKDAQKFADAHGINTGPTAIKSSLVESVERMTPDEFAANQPQLRKQLMDAEIAQKKAVTQKFEEAKTTDAYVNADNIEDFGRGLRDELVREGYDPRQPR
jgi:hypothetical protein